MTTSTIRRTRGDRTPAAPMAGRPPNPFTQLLKHLTLIAALVAMLYPLLWMLSRSFTPQTQIFADTGLLPDQWVLDNYIDGWNALTYGFEVYFANSLIVAIAAVAGNLISCSLAAFAVARLNFRAAGWILGVILLTIMLPYHVVVIPQYIMFSAIGWVNTFWPLILPKFLATDAFFIFLMVQFIRALPRDLDEAAKIDGCGPFRIYGRIVLPLTLPALATTAIFTFIWTWNDFFTPLIYLNDPATHTVPIALRNFLDATGQSSHGALFAMSMAALAPVVGFFIAAQRYLVEGIATTGAKG